MRTRVDKYTIVGDRQISLETPINIEDVRLIINETKKIVIASSMQKDNIVVSGNVITYTDSLPISEVGDKFTIEIDKCDTISDVVGKNPDATISEVLEEIKKASLGDGSVILNDVADGKKRIADAINSRGGNANPNSAFTQLAQDIEDLNDSFITYGVTAEPKIDWLQYLCSTNIEDRSYITEIDNDEITEINTNAFQNCINLKSVSLTNLTSITGTSVFNRCSSLKNVNIPNLTSITGGNVFYRCSSLEELNIENLNTIGGLYVFQECPLLKVLNFPKLTVFNTSNPFNNNTRNLRVIILGKITELTSNFLTTGQLNLRNITIGLGTDINLPFQGWFATNVINEGQSGIDELNSNLRTNLLEKLADHSADEQTRTLRLGWLAHVTQENIDYANSKGWTLTT